MTSHYSENSVQYVPTDCFFGFILYKIQFQWAPPNQLGRGYPLPLPTPPDAFGKGISLSTPGIDARCLWHQSPSQLLNHGCIPAVSMNPWCLTLSTLWYLLLCMGFAISNWDDEPMWYSQWQAVGNGTEVAQICNNFVIHSLLTGMLYRSKLAACHATVAKSTWN